MSRLYSMKTKVILFVAISTLALSGLAANSLLTLNTVKVGGDAYNEVLSSERLIADVLPPPAYIIEAYLTVQQLVNNTDPALDKVLRQRLVKLEGDFDERQTYYTDRLAYNPSLDQALTKDSQVAARRFFDLEHQQLLPALDRGDIQGARSIADNAMRDAYEEHRAAIDQVVILAGQDSHTAEINATNLVSSRTRLLGITVLVSFLITAIVGAVIAASIIRPVKRLVRTATVTLPEMVQRIRDTGEATVGDDELEVDSRDELGEATKAFNSVIMETVDMAKAQADLRRSAQENFVNLGRRSQNLLSRQIQLIEKAEEGEEDGEVLDTLFKIDHLAARMRRNAESLLVLADRPPARKRRGPASLDDVLRAASSEIEQYQRVRVLDGEVIDLDGQYAHELVHLFAELLENAVRFSNPETDVSVNAAITADGCTVAISDQGIGLSSVELEEANRRLTGGVALNQANYLGHFVVGRLASRLGATVRLESRQKVGLTAVVFLPTELLASGDENSRHNRPSLARRQPTGRVATSKATTPPVPAPAGADHAPSDHAPSDHAPSDHGQSDENLVPEAVEPVAAPAMAGTLVSADAAPSRPQPPTSELLPPTGALTAESFGLRKRESGTSLAKTQRASARADANAKPAGRNAETVRDRFSSFAAGKQQANSPQSTSSNPDEETTEDA